MSSWDTSSGLLEQFTLDVEEAWFGTNDKYMSGKILLLNLKGPATVDGDVVDPAHHIWYSCGDKWKAAQGGASAVNTTGTDSFNSQAGIGRLIDGIKALGDEAIDVMRGRGESFEADTWNGLVLELERTKVSQFTDKTTKELVEVYVNMPQSISVSSGQASAPAAETETPAAPSGGGLPPAALRKVLVKEAANHDDADDFMAHVLDNSYQHSAALTANEEILDEVIEGTIHAEAH